MTTLLVRGECTETVWEGVRSAIEMAQKRKDLVQVEVQPQHLMKVLLEQQNGLAVGIFNRVGVDTTRLLKATDERIQLQPQPMAMVWPKDVKQKCGFSFLAPVIERARAFRKEFGDTELSVEHLVLGFFEDAKFGKRLYEDFRISFNALKTAIGAIRRIQSVIHQVADGKYGKDLTAMASAGKLDPVIGRDDEIRRCIQILCRRTKNNPILIGEPGVGKTAISEGLAQRIVKGDVPQELTNRRLISLDMGTRYSGDFEAWLISLLEKVTKCNGQIILFIDDIHTVFGLGATEHSMGVGNLLQSMLGREELRCIGATTFDEYRKYIEKHPALERRFRQVYVDQPSREDTISILRGLRERFELHHGVSISDNSLVSAVDLSNRYISKRFLPDKAIDLVDEAAAKLKIEMTSRPTALDDLKRALLNLEMENHSLMKDRDKASNERAQRVEAQLSQLSLLKCQLEVAQKEADDCNMSGKSMFREEVIADDIAEIVNKWTGIPLCNLKQLEMEKLLHLEEDLHKRFVGQDRAVKAVAEAIQRSQAGLSDPHRPMTSFMFLGPTGVGKTELAKALAAHLFNTEEALVRIDMSEYMEKHAVSRLIGAPPGYLGYGEGGQLTETICRRPYAVILFDEIEQAHPDVFNLFLQILDDGRLTNSQGRVVDFTHTVIIMTSNVGSEYISGTKKMASYETMKQQVMEAAKAIFRPEFMNRVDEFIVFQTLDRDQINKIVRLQLGRVQHRLAERKIRIEATDAAVELIGKLGYDPTTYGARPVRRVIQQHVENELAKGMLRGDFKEDDDTLVLIDTEVTASGNWRLIQRKLVFKILGSASYVHPSCKGNSNIYALKNVFFNICIVYFLKLFGVKAPM